jgi:hypothetical protein
MMKSFKLKMRRVLAGNYPFFIFGKRAAIIHFSFWEEEGQLSIFGAENLSDGADNMARRRDI